MVPIDTDVEDAAIRLRRATRRKLSDAIVAASALVSGSTLATCDRELSETDFPGLVIFNPEVSPSSTSG